MAHHQIFLDILCLNFRRISLHKNKCDCVNGSCDGNGGIEIGDYVDGGDSICDRETAISNVLQWNTLIFLWYDSGNNGHVGDDDDTVYYDSGEGRIKKEIYLISISKGS